MDFELRSSAFGNGDRIPARYTCDGSDLSPELIWGGFPEGTKSLALICDDPDAPGGPWVHWVMYNIPTSRLSLPEGIQRDALLADGTQQGTNDFRGWGYGGPCPPRGPAHHYFFKLYALDTRLTLGSGVRKQDVERAMKGHVLDETALVGEYGRAE